ncbi:hypothetical protein OQZ33_04440 [Pedobacter sp. MC2016-05]|uniref:hypothetical protein n=1 Tax=Pedobacter sp. MC2016-05 TaxID=2994474 RepID=UPI002245CDAD|nr:hypothetical protein [Pedobacter sp. MC2016-05]MCX2473575.1 hypothetical protein [Pedobacter sp. MC2016-05]
MTEQEYRSHFENLAEKHRLILHSDTNKAFFYIESVDELNEFDEALNLMKSNVCMLIVASSGEFGDNNSESHVDEQNCEIYILMRKKSSQRVSDLYSATKEILKDCLARTKRDLRANPNPHKHFRFNNIPYQKVGPMNDDWYGYIATVTFTCPFGYNVNSGTWTDK